jgi:hypothetical protein
LNGPYDKTETHIRQLVGRSLNSFDLSRELLERLDSALAHSSSLSSAHHTKGRHRETYRHTFLLSDGSALTLWEVVHTTDREGTSLHELYTAEADAALAAQLSGVEAVLDPADFDGYAPTGGVLAAPASALPRLYVPDNSPDHARRLLRRAENADRPDERVGHLLRTAFAHHIAQVFGHRCHVDDTDAGFMLYEHAFLLLDGTEISLWEVEHTATPDGRHMCEVYTEEGAARAALESRSRVR